MEKDIVTLYFLASGEIESTDEDHGGLRQRRRELFINCDFSGPRANIREYLNYMYDLLPVYFSRCFRGEGANGKDTWDHLKYILIGTASLPICTIS